MQERDRADILIVWDPAVISPEQYVRLVTTIGDLVRSCGGLGIQRIRTDSVIEAEVKKLTS